MKRFALIGAAGYIAPRHLKAIKETGNCLISALDPFDSVGIIDSFFPDADFFTEPERFDRHLDRLRRKNQKIDYVSICSPNYLHDSHIRLGIRNGTDVICEKPIVLNPWNVDALIDLEKETGKNIYNILQLRLHPSIIAMQEKLANAPKDKIFDVDLTYITGRGKWYYYSWKGDEKKSGGVATNIGVHFFDMLIHLFGAVKNNVVHYSSPEKMGGFLQLERARVRWFLSIDVNDVPQKLLEQGQRTYRSITIGDDELEFSGGFTDLHTVSYQKILEGTGFRIEEARPCIEVVSQIRNFSPLGLQGDYHPFLKK
ncbi:MAG: Gfo/Idh/MocA family oxidoreductase [Bacteroidales bacterium]|nr:Gfo/Idh/MocA family oxidoreductase [Bacteroidales bacterium]